MGNTQITISTTIPVPKEQVWKYWTEPEHIVNWNNASDDWHTPNAENDLRIGGKFLSRMEAKDGSFGFDFSGVYDNVILYQLISYTLEDDRKVKITFTERGNETEIVETFDAEDENSVDLQKQGWQAILDHFKEYVESI